MLLQSVSLSTFATKKNNNNLVGSFLKYAYNHVLLEKTSRLYQIRYLTRLKLRIYFEHALFHHLSHSWQAGAHASVTGDQVYKSDINRSRLRPLQQEIWVGDYTKAPKCHEDLLVCKCGQTIFAIYLVLIIYIFARSKFGQNSKPFLCISLTTNLVLVNPRMYTQIQEVVGGGGMEPLPGVFDTLQ